jgi:hypothetical protein
MEMFVEFKHGISADPFLTEEEFFPKRFDGPCDTRDRMALYSTQQQSYQFRTSILSVGIFGNVARLFRWDRAGCQVTRPIRYSTKKGNQQLTEFFLRLDRMADDPEARGWDPTVEDATAEDVKRFSEAIKRVLGGGPGPGRAITRAQKRATDRANNPVFCGLIVSVGDRNKYPRKKVSIRSKRRTEKYIVGRSTSILSSPTGRATRGFVAVEVKTGKLVFLKDSWRPDVDGIESEDHWYRLLQKKKGTGTENIGAYSQGSDVYATRKSVKSPDTRQRTVGHRYARDHGRLEGATGYIHHRVVLPEFYFTLDTFKDSKHLLSVSLDIACGVFLQVIQRFFSPR